MHDIRILIHHPEADIEVRQPGIGFPVVRVLGPEAGGIRAAVAFVQVARRQDVGEDVDDRWHQLRSADTEAGRGSAPAWGRAQT